MQSVRNETKSSKGSKIIAKLFNKNQTNVADKRNPKKEENKWKLCSRPNPTNKYPTL